MIDKTILFYKILERLDLVGPVLPSWLSCQAQTGRNSTRQLRGKL
jgi:hypothetical protein